MSPDIAIYGSGFYQIQGETRRGRTFMRHVQGEQLGVAYCDDTRLTQEIADGAVAKGLRVMVNGRNYTEGRGRS